MTETLTDILTNARASNGGRPTSYLTLNEFLIQAVNLVGDRFATNAELAVLCDDRAHGFDVAKDYLTAGLIEVENLADDERDYVQSRLSRTLERSIGVPCPTTAHFPESQFRYQVLGGLGGIVASFSKREDADDYATLHPAFSVRDCGEPSNSADRSVLAPAEPTDSTEVAGTTEGNADTNINTGECPICKETTVEGEAYEFDGLNTIAQKMSCLSCDSEWTDYYKAEKRHIEHDATAEEETKSDECEWCGVCLDSTNACPAGCGE